MESATYFFQYYEVSCNVGIQHNSGVEFIWNGMHPSPPPRFNVAKYHQPKHSIQHEKKPVILNKLKHAKHKEIVCHLYAVQ